MEFLYAIILFILILIIYSQLMYQLKKGDDMEMYEIDYTNNRELNESANLKQPFLFVFSEFDSFFKNFSISQLASEYGSFDVNLKEIEDYHSNNVSTKSTVALNLGAVNTLMNSDSESKYFSNNNSNFIMETALFKQYKNIDAILQTPMCVSSNYDVLFGSHGATTPLTYHTHERRFIYVIGGKITVKMTPWRSNKYMIVNKDYSNYEFTSPLNVWDPQEQYKTGFLKMKFLDVIIHPGHVLYIPPFWFYSIQFEKDNRDVIVHEFNYGSIMNVVANSANLSQHFYQKVIMPITVTNKKTVASDSSL
jgi:hypothetical protein